MDTEKEIDPLRACVEVVLIQRDWTARKLGTIERYLRDQLGRNSFIVGPRERLRSIYFPSKRIAFQAMLLLDGCLGQFADPKGGPMRRYRVRPVLPFTHTLGREVGPLVTATRCGRPIRYGDTHDKIDETLGHLENAHKAGWISAEQLAQHRALATPAMEADYAKDEAEKQVLRDWMTEYAIDIGPYETDDEGHRYMKLIKAAQAPGGALASNRHAWPLYSRICDACPTNRMARAMWG